MKRVRLLPYQEERIALERAKREARKSHDPNCICPYCMTAEKAHEIFERALERSRAAFDEVP